MVNILSLLIHLILICILYHVKAHILFLAQSRVPYVYLTDLIVVLKEKAVEIVITEAAKVIIIPCHCLL